MERQGFERNGVVPWGLGLAGLIPFVLLTLALVTGQRFGWPPGTIAVALALYGATIASFLGGIRWGLAIAREEGRAATVDYALSVIPQLLAWAAFALGDRLRLVALGVIILALGPLDLMLVRRKVAPPWFGHLRIVLSLVAGACLILAGTLMQLA